LLSDDPKRKVRSVAKKHNELMADVPAIAPYQIQPLISNISIEVSCARAVGTMAFISFILKPAKKDAESEIYVGCTNGELIRFALQADDPNKVRGILKPSLPY
jgi:hypothetical protein